MFDCLCSSFRIIFGITKCDERKILVISGITWVLKQSLRNFIIIENSPKVQFDTDVILPEVNYKNYEKVAFTADLAWPNQRVLQDQILVKKKRISFENRKIESHAIEIC